jgi:hypothetical protein
VNFSVPSPTIATGVSVAIGIAQTSAPALTQTLSSSPGIIVYYAAQNQSSDEDGLTANKSARRAALAALLSEYN